jgi:hypothetical protein
MARCKANWCRTDHHFCVVSSRGLGVHPKGQFTLVRGSGLSVSAGLSGKGSHYYLRGRGALRRLAYTILRTVRPERRTAPKKRKARKGR